MSFSNEVKNEGARIHLNSSKLMLAELSAFIRTCSELGIKNRKISLEFVTENASIARRIFTLLKSYTSSIEAYRKKSTSLNKNGNYLIVINDPYAIDDLLYDTGFIKNREYFTKRNYKNSQNLSSEEEIRAYIRASFLGAGSITNPEKSYHLELIGRNEEFAEDIKDLLIKKGLNAKVATRKSSYIVYLKEAEQISDFMALIETPQSLLKFENVRVIKELRNNVNRVVNCETANINKQINASMKQIEDIKFLIEIGKFQNLDDDLKEIAMLRIENEDYSLKEIAEISKGKYSRSGVNYRLKKISNVSEKFRGANDEGNES